MKSSSPYILQNYLWPDPPTVVERILHYQQPDDMLGLISDPTICQKTGKGEDTNAEKTREEKT